MSWRRIVRQLPAVTLVLLGLVLVAPLSSGDRGLWLSVAPSAALLIDAPAGGLPPEHSTVLPDRQVQPAQSSRTEQVGPHRSLASAVPLTSLVQNGRGRALRTVAWATGPQPIAARAGPRAPPV